MSIHNFAHLDAAVVASPLTLPRASATRGGHRTETAGCSNNAKSIAILFNAYEAASEMMPGAGSEIDDVTAELEAMVAVGQALARLHDVSGRRRVLNWAVQRFEAADANVVVAADVARHSDPTLEVGDLSDLFDSRHTPLLPAEAAHQRAADGFDQPAAGLPAATLDEEMPAADPSTPRLKLLVLHFANSFRRFAFGVGSPETV
jgi:hypothetical protein